MEYDQIGYYKDNLLVGYNYNNIIANKSGMYGIISYKDGTIVEEFKYEEKQLEEVLAKININEWLISRGILSLFLLIFGKLFLLDV